MRYLEDGREAFGKTYGLSYLDFYGAGIAVPIVSIHCDYKRPLHYGDVLRIKTVYQPSAAAKLLFSYEIRKGDFIVATGSSTQVFVDSKTFELHLTIPGFYEDWRKKWNI